MVKRFGNPNKEREKRMKRIFKDKFSTVVIKSSKTHGYLASTYTSYGVYVGCRHLEINEIDDFIKYELSDYKEVTEE